MNNRLLKFALAGLIALMPWVAGVAETMPEAELTVYFFHDTACASCDGTEDFLAIVGEQLRGAGEEHPYTLKMYNTFTTSGAAAFAQVLAEYGLEDAGVTPPVAIVGGVALQGLERIEQNLREYFLTAAELSGLTETARLRVENDDPDDLFAGFAAEPGDSMVLYFYRATCEECLETAPVIDALPETLEIDGRESTVQVIRLNTRAGGNRDRVMALFAHYAVPEDKQMVPIVFLRDSYLAGYDEISALLLPSLEAGGGQSFVFPGAEAR